MAPSLLWNFFEKIDSDNAKCNNFKAILKTKQGSTKGIKGHLTRHAGDYTKYLQMLEEAQKNESVSKKRKAEDQLRENCLKQPKTTKLPENLKSDDHKSTA